MISERQTNSLSLDCLLSKWSDSRSALPTDPHTSPPPSLTSGGNDEFEPNTADFRVDHHLWGDWTFIRISPVSVTKLTLSLRVSFTSSHLTVDKLFPDNQRAITGPQKMSLLLETRDQKHACIDLKPRLILVSHMDDLWLVHNVQPAGKDVRSKPQQDCQKDKCYAKAVRVLHHKQYSNWLDVSWKLFWKENFPKRGPGAPFHNFFIIHPRKKYLKSD